jgi:Ca-activated chloride channel homolog
MRFAAPLALLALLVVPIALVGWHVLRRRRHRHAVSYTNVAVLAGVIHGRPGFRTWLPPALALAALTVLALGVARPQLSSRILRPHGTVVLVINASGPPLAGAGTPASFARAKALALDFVRRLPATTNVGIISIGSDEVEIKDAGGAPSDDVNIVSYPIRDRRVLRLGIAAIERGLGGGIDDGLAEALGFLRRRPARRSVNGSRRADRHPAGAILLLSDGTDTTGTAAALHAARRASRLRIPIDTVALGVAGDPGGAPGAGVLARIATTSGGRFTATTSQSPLAGVSRQIGFATVARRSRELTFALDGAGAVLVAAAMIGALAWRPRLP